MALLGSVIGSRGRGTVQGAGWACASQSTVAFRAHSFTSKVTTLAMQVLRSLRRRLQPAEPYVVPA